MPPLPAVAFVPEVYGAFVNGRRGVGVELKPSYFRQAIKNLESARFGECLEFEQQVLFTPKAEAEDVVDA